MEDLTTGQIFAGVIVQFTPVWIGIVVIMGASAYFKQRLSLYGRLFDSPVGMVGLALVLFWALTALFADQIATMDPLEQFRVLKNKPPGTFEPESGIAALLGGDNLGRDVFSRMVWGSVTVMQIAPTATLVALMVGITMGLPAGYYGGYVDTALSFLANLVLAFPVILLFYLLVTPEIRSTVIPTAMASVVFLIPILFVIAMIYSKLYTRPDTLWYFLLPAVLIGLFMYTHLINVWNPTGVWLDANGLNIFVSVVFVTSPAVFRIVRGLTMDIKTRDYVAASQTRGEGPWYIMLWEILPNARGPLIVDACLRIGYTTILLGTLGFFGLGVSPESSDWGMTINEGRKLLRLFPHAALPPALAIMTLVLGLNLLADGLREQSLKD
ncbi:MAG: ABC transporter permease [Pseudomonadota bacterium]